MLKIKEEVNHQDLLDFGFEYGENGNNDYFYVKEDMLILKDRILRISTYQDNMDLDNYLDLVYDLIQLNFVEKE